MPSKRLISQSAAIALLISLEPFAFEQSATAQEQVLEIAVEGGGALREGSGGLAQYVLYCDEFSVALSFSFSADGFSLHNVQLDGSPANSEMQTEIESQINAMGGFHYPYLLCTDTKVTLAFDYHRPDGEIASVGVELN